MHSKEDGGEVLARYTPRVPLLREGRKQIPTPTPTVRDLVTLPPPQALSSVTLSHHTFKVLLTYVPLS